MTTAAKAAVLRCSGLTSVLEKPAPPAEEDFVFPYAKIYSEHLTD